MDEKLAGGPPNLPGDFKAVSGCVPDWIDIKDICKEAGRYIGLYAIDNMDVVAINNGRTIFTTSDRNGEFRRAFRRIVRQVVPPAADPVPNPGPTLVYDCEAQRQWVAPRPSAVRFLYEQF